MPPSSSSRSTSAPYSRRPSNPKSSRQQFSACGACRMRRVRCDLKDLSPASHSACSNCKERGLKCVDEFADVKTVKLLRRGRRLQQVEAIYGKVNGSEQHSSATQLPLQSPPPSLIPQLHPDFFSSPFWHRFNLQRPFIDPVEFPARFLAHVNDSHPLSPEATIITMLLVVWAASFGLDERGLDSQDPDQETPAEPTGSTASDRDRRQRRDRTHTMLREILHLIDLHGILRRPTWDGVRVLLLLSPLTEELLPPLDTLTTYEATIAQVHALSTHAPTLAVSLAMHSPTSSNLSAYASDTLVKARAFWYAFVHEGITTALRGGRLVLDQEDLETFQSTLPSFNSNPPSAIPSPVSATFPGSNDGLLSMPLHPHLHPQMTGQQQRARTQQQTQGTPQQSFLLTARLFALPVRISIVCRKVHATLTGRDARRRAERGLPIDSDGVQEVWDGLDTCWEEFENMRRSGIGISAMETERYVGSWQIFIFECHNIVREALKQHIVSHSPPGGGSPTSLGYPSTTPPSSSCLSPYRLHALAVSRCMGLLPRVLSLVKMHVDAQGEGTELFRWDAGLVGDGCFFAGFLAAGGEREFVGDHDGFAAECGFGESAAEGMAMGMGMGLGVGVGMGMGMDQKEGVQVCLTALADMRWAFAKGEEREQTIRMVWETRGRHNLMKDFHTPGLVDVHAGYRLQSLHQHQQHLQPQHHLHQHHQQQPQHHHTQYNNALQHAIAHGAIERPMLPPLTLSLSPRHTQTIIDTSAPGSAPHTASTDGSASGWPVYTPPATGTSGCSARSGGSGGGGGGGGASGDSVGPGGSGGGGRSPGSVYAGMQQQEHAFQKNEELELELPLSVSVSRDGFYHHHSHAGGEMDTFSFSVPGSDGLQVVGYQQQQQQQQQQQAQAQQQRVHSLSHSHSHPHLHSHAHAHNPHPHSHHQQQQTVHMHPNGGSYLDVFSSSSVQMPVPVSVSVMGSAGTRSHSASDHTGSRPESAAAVW